MKTIRFVLVSFVASLTSVPAMAQNGHQWKTYQNGRFGFSVCYPADLVVENPPPENGDGLKFRATNGAEIAVWGSHYGHGSTFIEAAHQDANRLAGSDGQITYEAVKKSFYIVSGRSGDKVFYNRTFLTGNIYSTVDITYPSKDAAVWDLITSHVSGCFHPSRQDQWD